MRKFKVNLIVKIIFAIILGLLFGLFIPESIVRVFITFNGIFANFLGFCIPLIIVGLVVSGIADLGKGAGKLLFLTVIIAYGSTLFSGFLTFASFNFFSFLIIDSSQTGLLTNTTSVTNSLKPFFVIGMPPVFDVMTALVLSFLIGIGSSFLEGTAIKSFFSEFKQIIEKVITTTIIPFLPLFIFGIFLNMSYSGEAIEVIQVFGKVIVFILALSVILLLIQFTFAGIVVKSNPLPLLKTMLPAYMTALGTASSAATIPVTLAQAKKNGVSTEVADFTVPLCATIHLAGSTMKIAGMALAILLLQGNTVDFFTFAGFIMMLGITMVAAPGVPGGAVMAAVAILQSILGFNEQAVALMIAVYVAIDSFGTACNVTGDGAIALVVNKFAKKNK